MTLDVSPHRHLLRGMLPRIVAGTLTLTLTTTTTLTLTLTLT